MRKIINSTYVTVDRRAEHQGAHQDDRHDEHELGLHPWIQARASLAERPLTPAADGMSSSTGTPAT
jgi:hypothetical protein